MKVVSYTNGIFSVIFSNSTAFKEDAVKGPCLRYQKALHGQNRSIHQSRNLWQRH